MMKKTNIFTGLMAGLFLTSCVLNAAAKPDWIDGSPGYYPNSQYMTATASAGNAELAKNRALGNLSKVFEAHIKESSMTKSDTHVNIDNGAESFTKRHRLSQQVQVRTDKIVNGAQIAETWKDESVLTYHALAVLERAQASNNIREELSRLDNETQSELDRSGSEKDVLISMSALNNALSLQQERYSLQKMLKVIDTRGKGSSSYWNMAQLRGQLESKLQTLAISTAVDNDPMGKLDQYLKSAMGNAGFPASNNGVSQFTLVANLDVQDLGFRQGWYWLRGKLSVKLVEKDGKIRGRKQWPLKVSALQHGDAESRLMTQVSKKLNADIKPAIIEFATGVQ